MKRDAILDDIKKGVLGSTVAYVYTIEFQKRGLPHMHILIFFHDSHKLRTPSDIDSLIRARWPDKDTQPKLFETVCRCMVHGPCGAANPGAPCMVNGRCSKGYPKPFQDFTTMDADGYPAYYRPNDGTAHDVGGFMVDNSWLVPFCPWLSAKYDCHINTECAVSFASIKYVHKYIYKGHDCTTMQINRQDEIRLYLDSRYVSAAEACWRLFHFKMHNRNPAVLRLQVHLPGHHMVTFDPEEPVESILARAANESTMLTAFFDANASATLGPEARQYTYQEFPRHFTFIERTRKWKIREKGSTIGRLSFVPPTAGELFYLRTLLCVVRGPHSFQDLRTFETTVYPTFREACVARGLLEDDGEWAQCLEEAIHMQTGASLRQLFATLLLFCTPVFPEILWDKFRSHICDDLAHRLRSMGYLNPSLDDVYDYGLFLLESILQRSGSSLTNFESMPKPQRLNWAENTANRLICEQLYNCNDERAAAERNIPLLNPEQRHAFDAITDSVENNLGRLFFLNGPGGTGKTFVYNTVCHHVRSKGLIVLCVASSGIAALLLRGGRTAHSTFKIPISALNEDSTCQINKNSQLASLLRMVRLIVWDEITMQHRHAAEAVDRTLRDLLDRPDSVFGGITVVFGGDFQQILPVVPHGGREETVGASLQRSPLWLHILPLRLWRNMRIDQDQNALQFSDWLHDIGHGIGVTADGNITLSPAMTSPTLSDLIDYIYPDVACIPPPSPEYFLDRAILSPRNGDVEDINHTILEKLHGDKRIYLSADTILQADGTQDPHASVPAEFLRAMPISGMPPGELRLKVGAPIIIMRNLAPDQGVCNGTRAVVEELGNRVLKARILGGSNHGNIILVPRITVAPSDVQGDFTFTMQRRQFPVRLAFAMTINKSQGQSLKYVGVDLRTPVFTHGQLYVALSRATSGRRIKILLSDNTVSDTLNIVYPEVLLD